MTIEILLDPGLLGAVAGGVLLGVFVGAVPGLTATLAIALLLPVTFHLPATHAVVMMTGIFTGGIYGGSIAAIMLRIPGAPASAMTMLDGHAMARSGRAGTAIGLATLSSFVGGIFGGVVLVLFAPQLARFALRFGSPEMFALVLLALVAVATVSPGSLAKGMVATVLGLMLSTVGIDRLAPVPRFTFGSVDFLIGVPLIPVVIGLFALTELFERAGGGERGAETLAPAGPSGLEGLWAAAREAGAGTFLKSPLIGTVVGALPGAGAAMAAFLAYSEAKRSSPRAGEFGTGVPEGIVAPESANNAMTGGAFIPMLAFGIPGDAVTAVILGGLIVHGITPGPQLFTESAHLVEPLFGAYFLSYVLILGLGLLLIPVFTRIASVPAGVLFPLIGALAVVASFTSEGSTFAVVLTVGVGVLGFALRRFGYPVIPVLLGLILGPMLESNYRRSLILAEGSPIVFFRSPICVALLLAALALPLYSGRRAATRPTAVPD